MATATGVFALQARTSALSGLKETRDNNRSDYTHAYAIRNEADAVVGLANSAVDIERALKSIEPMDTMPGTPVMLAIGGAGPTLHIDSAVAIRYLKGELGRIRKVLAARNAKLAKARKVLGV